MLNSQFFCTEFLQKVNSLHSPRPILKAKSRLNLKTRPPWLLFEPQEQVFRRGDHFLTGSGRIFCWKEKQEQLWAAGSHKSFHFCANEQLLCHAQPHSCASLQLLHKFCSKNRTQLSKLNVAPSLDKRAIVNGGCDLRVWDSGNKGGWLS